MVLEIRVVIASGGGRWYGNNKQWIQRNFLGVMEIFFILIGQVVAQVYTFFNTHLTAYLISVYFTVCKL